MELIKGKDTIYQKYENLLLRREHLKKQAEQANMNYIRIFGDLITEIFQLKIECIKKKKMIGYCQTQLNNGKEINSTALNNYIEVEMSSYYLELQQLLEDVKNSKKSTNLALYDIKQIRDLYYKLAKKIHPDIRPDLKDDKTIQELWNRITLAYQYNVYEELQRLEVLVNNYLKSIGYEVEDITIDNIEDKIQKINEEINTILSTIPYQYRYILEDEDSMNNQKKEYQEEKDNYEAYSKQLDEVLSSFPIKEYYA